MSDHSSDLPPEIAPTLHHDQNAQVAIILDQYLEDLQNGRACSREELLAQNPELRSSLVEYLDGIEMVAGLGVGSELVPQRIGDFEIVKPIGRGAMGVVYLANQVSLKRRVALKVLRYTVAGKQATQRFEREAELVAALRHSNVVPIYATGEEENLHYLAMQLIDGPSLAQWSAEDHADRDELKIASWGAQVARALAHAHHTGVIHRDVKPSNLLKDGDHIWLTDFGLARRHDDLRMSMTGAMLGTPNYMSPEQAAPTRFPVDYRTDIYSLGATLFELLTGRCVFVAETPHSVLAQILTEEPEPLREVLPSASRDLETILMKCLEKDPADRYATSEQLAEDLEAFSQGQSIKARRPSLLERVTRWRRQNQKAFQWSTTAAAVAALMIGLTYAAWFSWTNAKMGRINISSDEGPIVGRLIDASGIATPAFTIPTQESLSVDAGEYTLQMWAGGRLGSNEKVRVSRKQLVEVRTSLSDDGVFVERTVLGIPRVLPLGDRDDLVFFHQNGITRVDGRSGENLWTAEANEFVPTANRLTEKEQQEKRDQPSSFDRSLVRDIRWGRDFERVKRYDDPRLPLVCDGFSDINEDDQREVLIAFPLQPAFLAFDGRSGDLLWRYFSIPPVTNGNRSTHNRAGCMHAPKNIGDIDGDNVADVAGVFCSKAGSTYRWIDAVSGKSGKRIWRKVLDEKWFDAGVKIVPEFSQFNFNVDPYTRFSQTAGQYWRYRTGLSFRRRTDQIVPWDLDLVPDPTSNTGKQLVVACGTRLLSLDPSTGKGNGLNKGLPIELGFIPALQPKIVRETNNHGKAVGVLLCEAVALANPRTGTAPLTRFSVRSLESGEQLWQYESSCDPAWIGAKPDWPLVEDLDGDSIPEILIVDDADLQNRIRGNASCFSSIKAIDAKSGKLVWKPEHVARIRSQDRQIQNILMGPDVDGDHQDDVYAITFMQKGNDGFVFIDILSAEIGSVISTQKYKLPFAWNQDRGGLDFESPFFLGSKDQPLLVIATRDFGDQAQRQRTLVISTSKQEIVNVGDQLESPIQADGDGDGWKDLFLVKPRVRNDIDGVGQLVSLKAVGGRGDAINVGELQIASDVDKDGIKDLFLKSEMPIQGFELMSGATGEQLSDIDFEERWSSLTSTSGDVDGDGIEDFLATAYRFNSNDGSTGLLLISGASGSQLWNKEIPTDGFGLNAAGTARELGGTDYRNLLLIHRHRSDGPGNISLRLSCVDAKSGIDIWSTQIGATGSTATDHTLELSNYEYVVRDVNGDGVADVICPCFDSTNKTSTIAIDGVSGERIWELPFRSFGRRNDLPFWHSAVVDADDEHGPMFVSARNEQKRGTIGSIVVDFYSLKDGTLLNTWTTNGRLVEHGNVNGEKLPFVGVPFPVVKDDKVSVGLCFDNESFELSVTVLDLTETQVKQRRTFSSREFVAKDQAWEYHEFAVIADSNRDGSTDAVFYSGDDIVAVDLVSGNELIRKTHDGLKALRYDPDFCDSMLIAETQVGANRRLKLLDLKSLEVVWDLHMPRNKRFKGFLNDTIAKKEDQRPPKALYAGEFDNPVSLLLSGSSAEFRGVGGIAAFPISESVVSSNSVSIDERSIEPLPWNDRYQLKSYGQQLLSTLTEEIPVALGVIVIPFLFLRSMWRRKQWSLQLFLLVPLVFVVPFMALKFEYEMGQGLADMSGMPAWLGKLWATSFVVPTLVFASSFFQNLWNRQWRALFWLSSSAVGLSIIVGAIQLYAGSHILPGSHYDWFDVATISLLSTGCWMVGTLIVLKWGFVALASLVASVFGLLRRPKVVTAQ